MPRTYAGQGTPGETWEGYRRMARGRVTIVGRQAELAALYRVFDAAGDDAVPDPGRLVLLRGPAGSGRSTLLDTVARAWRRVGAQVLTWQCGTDSYGIPALLAAVREHYERVSDLRLAESINLVGQLADADPARLPFLAAELTTLFTRVRGNRRTVLLADDAHRPAEPEPLLDAARHAGCLVIAAVDADRVTDGLAARTDQLLDLAPLTGAETEELITAAIGGPVDDAVLPALRAALGPLHGNPGAVLSIVDELRAAGRLCFVRDRICLKRPAAPIPLPVTHPLVERYTDLEPVFQDLLGLLTRDPRTVAELADRDHGRALDRLVGRGLLVVDDRDRVTFPAPALAAALADPDEKFESPNSDEDAYFRVTGGYADGDWNRALSAARELELSDSAETLARRIARLHAAEICAQRGELRRAAAWLADASGFRLVAAGHGWVRTGMLYQSGDVVAALQAGWVAFERATGPHCLDRLLIRLAEIAVAGDQPEQARRALAALDRVADRLPAADLERTGAYLHGLVSGDREAALTAVKLARAQHHQPDLLNCLLAAAPLADHPADLLTEAHALAERLGAVHARTRTRDLMRANGCSLPRQRPSRDALSGTERRIIALIRAGCTNRQIALDVRISEKTVENQLTRLFAKTGCRSRLELAAASLEGRFGTD